MADRVTDPFSQFHSWRLASVVYCCSSSAVSVCFEQVMRSAHVPRRLFVPYSNLADETAADDDEEEDNVEVGLPCMGRL